MVIAGLVLTVVGWLIQMYRTVIMKDTKLNPAFLGAYAFGCILLAISGFRGSDAGAGVLNLIDVILPLIILWTITIARKAT
jgi:uncharacterized protein with PQ loop repeat